MKLNSPQFTINYANQIKNKQENNEKLCNYKISKKPTVDSVSDITKNINNNKKTLDKTTQNKHKEQTESTATTSQTYQQQTQTTETIQKITNQQIDNELEKIDKITTESLKALTASKSSYNPQKYN